MPSSPPPGVHEDAPSIGDSRYALVARIGEGGMAGVYRAWDHRLRVMRAVKVLLPECANRPQVRQRFESEAHIMARLEHTNLVRIYDVGDAGPLPFIVMELVTGGTLTHWLTRNGPMSPRMATSVVLQVCRGVEQAHAAGVVHRDIKPHNVLISPTGHCKLTDFGIAQSDHGLTRTGSSLGTLGYRAPEQRDDAKTVDARADIFSLGATLWTLLAAEPPNDLFMAHENPRMLAPIPPELRPVVLRCVAYERDQRYPDVQSLVADLEAALSALAEDPPYAPDLVFDLTEEEPLDGTPDFPEIRALLDGGPAKPATDETLRPPVSQRKALPYYMPTTDLRARRRAITGRDATDDDDDDLPDYVDREAMDGADPQREIDVGVADVRPGAPTRPAPRREAPSPEDEVELPGHLQTDAASPDPEPAPAVREPQRPRRAAEPPRARPEPAPPGMRDDDDDGSPIVRIASLLVGGLLASGTVMVVLALLVFGFNAWRLYGAASVTSNSRQNLYATLDKDRPVIDQMAGLGGDRIALHDAYLAWLTQSGEPERMLAAERFLTELDQQSNELLSHDGSTAQREVEHVIRRIRSARKQYREDVALWDQRAGSLFGRMLIAIGAGSGPPK